MARRRIGVREVPELREAFAERLRTRGADYAERLGCDPASFERHRLAALDAAEPVHVQGWELRGLVALPRGSAIRSFVLEPDRRLSAL